MARKLPRKDVVVIGLGWTGSILSNELCDEGLDVVAIERGPWRDTANDFSITYAQDELRYRLQHDLFLRPAQTSVTFRNNGSQTALPVRTWGAFMLGNGAGGAGVHWNAETWRFAPSDFVARSHLTERYGAKFLPEDMTIQDLGHYRRRSRAALRRVRISVRHFGAGRQSQRRHSGGRQSVRRAALAALSDATHEAGLRPRAVRGRGTTTGLQAVSATLGQSFTALHKSPGRQAWAVTYCGFCEWFGCANYSKATPQTTSAGAAAKTEFRSAHRLRGPSH